MGLFRPARPGKCIAISLLNVFRFTPEHDLQAELHSAGIVIVLFRLCIEVPRPDGNEPTIPQGGARDSVVSSIPQFGVSGSKVGDCCITYPLLIWPSTAQFTSGLVRYFGSLTNRFQAFRPRDGRQPIGRPAAPTIRFYDCFAPAENKENYGEPQVDPLREASTGTLGGSGPHCRWCPTHNSEKLNP
jgi:hypothetical protein